MHYIIFKIEISKHKGFKNEYIFFVITYLVIIIIDFFLLRKI